ncbi:recombinase family protein [Sphingomonas yunnanensis]|uniref:recombinase family protein n=1 Tax=Sphingomonas yunnanensis TaxID=310400 RepID=UPI001FEBE5A2|nr:recombinase family protein [Sphingomonas yunnanensis]
MNSFAAEQGFKIAARYVENESGAKLYWPELFRLLADCEPVDVLLVEQVDRLSRLTSSDWQRLRGLIDAKQVRIVALDLPTSWSLTAPAEEFTARMFAAVNAMMLDVHPQSLARAMRICVVARPRALPRRRQPCLIEAVQRITLQRRNLPPLSDGRSRLKIIERERV